MPKFDDPALKQRVQDLERQIEDAPDDQDTADLERQLEQAQAERKAKFDQNKADWKGSRGQGGQGQGQPQGRQS